MESLLAHSIGLILIKYKQGGFPMTIPTFHPPEQIHCPIRKKEICSEVCHSCANHIKVIYKSENPPEFQCSCWDWSIDKIDRVGE
jgi:hypothetical protein